MSFQIEAPLPAIERTVLMPSPLFSDTEALTSAVTSKRAIDGTLYTYVKSQTRKKLQWTLRLSRGKALELRSFILNYAADKVRITDHRGDIWVGYMTNNPFEFDTTKRSVGGRGPTGTRGEQQTITIEFEGEKQ